ncbi:MAG: hypothetical protein JNK82_04045 [Myxococcaceae bacterium]|nr:hypothetical protein [Myxococcaceae bacterium]
MSVIERGRHRTAREVPGCGDEAILFDMSGAELPLYFTWDDPMTAAELRASLAAADDAEKARLLGKVMREARDTDVWAFTSLAEVRRLMPLLDRYLGRRRAFWKYLLAGWESLGLG